MYFSRATIPWHRDAFAQSREALPADEMIRFVAGPDGSVVPDLKRVLPGRGCSVKAERRLLEKAVQKNIFARALKKNVTPPATLADQVDRLLVANLTGMMNMARKAGQFVSGSTKVDNAVRSGEALAVFHATDAADDGISEKFHVRPYARSPRRERPGRWRWTSRKNRTRSG